MATLNLAKILCATKKSKKILKFLAILVDNFTKLAYNSVSTKKSRVLATR